MYHQSIGSSFGCDRSGAIIVNWPGAIHLLAQIVLRVAVANWSGAIHLPARWDSTSVIPAWRRSPPIVACLHASPVVKVFADTNALGQARCAAGNRLGEMHAYSEIWRRSSAVRCLTEYVGTVVARCTVSQGDRRAGEKGYQLVHVALTLQWQHAPLDGLRFESHPLCPLVAVMGASRGRQQIARWRVRF